MRRNCILWEDSYCNFLSWWSKSAKYYKKSSQTKTGELSLDHLKTQYIFPSYHKEHIILSLLWLKAELCLLDVCLVPELMIFVNSRPILNSVYLGWKCLYFLFYVLRFLVLLIMYWVLPWVRMSMCTRLCVHLKNTFLINVFVVPWGVCVSASHWSWSRMKLYFPHK